MSGRILIIDPVAPSPYSDHTLATSAMGGTEATVVRVATELAKDRQVIVAQRARDHEQLGRHGVVYAPYHHDRALRGVDTVIVIRGHKLLPRLRSHYPRARMFLWMHCFPGRRLRRLARIAANTRATVVAVSDYHRAWMKLFFREHDPIAAEALDIATIYNPVDDDLEPDGRSYDHNKLLFLSSPHKGLEQVATAFAQVRRQFPRMQLWVANPGYLDRDMPDIEGIQVLGKLPHARVIDHLRDSLCLFYPQAVFPETFGLVFAEANAVGTPVLAHPLGAASEVLGSRSQLVDARDIDAVCQRVATWRNGRRPQVRLSRAFRLSQVALAWRDLLTSHYPATDLGILRRPAPYDFGVGLPGQGGM